MAIFASICAHACLNVERVKDGVRTRRICRGGWGDNRKSVTNIHQLTS